MGNTKHYVAGADPGKHGAVVLLSVKYNPARIAKDDIIMIPVKATDGKLDVSYLWNALYPYKDRIDLYMQEDVHALFGSSAKGTFEFGDANGSLRTVLQLLGELRSDCRVRLLTANPKIWQKKAWKPEHIRFQDEVDTLGRKKKDTKATSLAAAKDLFPGVSFVPRRAKLPHDGLVDAALIAYYALTLIKGQESGR